MYFNNETDAYFLDEGFDTEVEDMQSNFVEEVCEVRDFITQKPCQLEPEHDEFHDAGNGVVFAIGYSSEDAKEWS